MNKFLLIISFVTFFNSSCELRKDIKKNKFYCLNPYYSINQKEYDKLVKTIVKLANEKKATDYQLFFYLRTIGTETALQLIEDLKNRVYDSNIDVVQQFVR